MIEYKIGYPDKFFTRYNIDKNITKKKNHKNNYKVTK